MIGIVESEELLELHERAGRGEQRKIGLTMAVFAAGLAMVTLMGHRLHTEEVVLQTKVVDGWAYYQAKNTRSQMYAADARLAELQGAAGTALGRVWTEKAAQEKSQADEIRHDTEALDHETQLTASRANFFDASEVFLEIAIVLCSIALLTGGVRFWQISFLSAAIGLVTAVMGFRPPHG
jgi:uncharacterized protein DUF4337